MALMSIAAERGISLSEMLETPAWEFPYWEAYYAIRAKEQKK